MIEKKHRKKTIYIGGFSIGSDYIVINQEAQAGVRYNITNSDTSTDEGVGKFVDWYRKYYGVK